MGRLQTRRVGPVLHTFGLVALALSGRLCDPAGASVLLCRMRSRRLSAISLWNCRRLQRSVVSANILRSSASVLAWLATSASASAMIDCSTASVDASFSLLCD